MAGEVMKGGMSDRMPDRPIFNRLDDGSDGFGIKTFSLRYPDRLVYVNVVRVSEEIHFSVIGTVGLNGHTVGQRYLPERSAAVSARASSHNSSVRRFSSPSHARLRH